MTLSFSLGARPAFGVGPDLRYMYLYRPAFDPVNPTSDHFGGGFFFQATYLLGGAWRFAGGLQGSRLIDKFFLPTGELGISYRTASAVGKEAGGYGIHLGFVPIFNFFDLVPFEHGPAFRGVIGVGSKTNSEFIIGHDFRAPSACYWLGCTLSVEGRPLRFDAQTEPMHAPLFAQRARRPRPAYARRVDPALHPRLLAHFAQGTSTECASIPAFLALARDLEHAGAPAALVARARRSAAEEATHTALCRELAGGFGDLELQTVPPPVPRLADTNHVELLKRLALESFWDGCVGEGAAAARARRQYANSKNAHVSASLAVIARDEQTHADLSERIVAFCLEQGGAPVRDALHESIEQRQTMEEASLASNEPATDDEEALAELGVPDAAVMCLAREEALEHGLRIVG